MKRIALLGGMSWESTIEYYRLLNEGVKERLGGLHSADCLIASVDFAPIAEAMNAGEWEKVYSRLLSAARKLEQSGGDFLMICTNTMHYLADRLKQEIAIPLLHIAEAAGGAVRKAGIGTVALLGTHFVMEQDFYRGILEQNFGVQVLVPEAEDRDFIHRAIFEELCAGIFREETKKRMLDIIEVMNVRGAEGVILGCTELPLIITQ